MPTFAVSHIAIGVRNLEASLHFYRDLLGGLHVSREQEEEMSGLAGKPSVRRAAYLRWNEGPRETFLVLDEQVTDEPHGEPAKMFQIGVRHFGFWIDDLEETFQRLVEAGVKVMHAPVRPERSTSERYGEEPGKKIMGCFVYDPDGFIVQLDQRLD